MTAETMVFTRRHQVLVIALVILGGALGYAAGKSAVTYRGKATVYVRTGDGRLLTDQQVRSYASIVRSSLVLEPIIGQLSLPTSELDLADRLTVTIPPRTALIEVTAEDTNDVRAADTANATVATLRDAVGQLETASGSGRSTVALVIVSEAAYPAARVSKTPRFSAAGAVMGGVIAVLLAYAFSRRKASRSPRGDPDSHAAS